MSAKDQIKQIVDYFKREPYIKDKTDGMAEGLMLGANLADEANELSKSVDGNFKILQQEYTENGNGSQSTAELIAARDGEEVINDRLNRDFGTIKFQLSQTDFMKVKPTVFEEFSDRKINVKWFGAKGNANFYNPADGKRYVDEDFTIESDDDTVAIQKAIDYIYSKTTQWNLTGGWMSGGGTLYFPNGHYWVSSKLILKENVTLEGESKSGTVLNGHDSIDWLLTNIEKITLEDKHHKTGDIRNLTIIGGGIHFLQNANMSIKRVWFFNIDNRESLLIQLPVGVKLYDVFFNNCRSGPTLSGNAGNGPATTTYFDKVWIQHCTYGFSFSFDLNSLLTTSIKNSIVEYTGTALTMSGSIHLTMEDIHFEQNTDDVKSYLKQGSNINMRDIWSDKGAITFYTTSESMNQRHKIFLKNIQTLSKILVQNGSMADVYLENDNVPIYDLPVSGRLFKGGYMIGNKPPTNLTYSRGDLIVNPTPVIGDNVGFICIESGTPGQWGSTGKVLAN